MVAPEPLSRRAALLTVSAATGVAAVTAGCGPQVAGPRATSGATDPDQRLLREALRRERRVQERVADARRSHPRLSEGLRAVDAVHREHGRLLRRSVEQDEDVTVETRRFRRLPAAEEAARLAGEERAVAEAHAGAALEARSGPFARVLAGMAAASDQQALLLDRLATETSTA